MRLPLNRLDLDLALIFAPHRQFEFPARKYQGSERLNYEGASHNCQQNTRQSGDYERVDLHRVLYTLFEAKAGSN